MYNAAIGFPTLSGGSSGNITALYNYLDLEGYPLNHNNFIIQQASPGAGAHLTLVQDYNTIVWGQYGANTGTGTLDTFATSNAVNAPGGYNFTYDKSEQTHNVLVSNFNNTIGSGTTAALVRVDNQATSVGTAAYSLSGGVATVTSFVGNAGGTLSVGEFFGCGAPQCSHPVKILSLGSGTGGTGTYSVDDSTTIGTQNGQIVQLFPGIVTNVVSSDNWFDKTGLANGAVSPYIIDVGNIFVGPTAGGTVTIADHSLITGGSCNQSSC